MYFYYPDIKIEAVLILDLETLQVQSYWINATFLQQFLGPMQLLSLKDVSFIKKMRSTVSNTLLYSHTPTVSFLLS
jgi:hypothetical protein